MGTCVYNIKKILRWSLSLAMLLFILGCGGSNSKEKELGQLTVDESLLPEQQLEWYKIQSNAFVDSIRQNGFRVLGGGNNDNSIYVFYAKDTIYYHTHNWGGSVSTWIPPILCKDIKNGKNQKVSIPNTIDGHIIKINMILESYNLDDKILLIVTDKKSDELEYRMREPVDVICFNGNDFSFNYIVGGHPWTIDRNDEIIYRYDALQTIPFSGIIDGTYKDFTADIEICKDSIDSQKRLDIIEETGVDPWEE